MIHIDPDSTSLDALPTTSRPFMNTKVVFCSGRVSSNNPYGAVPTYTYIFCKARQLNPRLTGLCVTRFSQKKQYSKQDTLTCRSYLTSFSYGNSPLPMPHRVMGSKPKDISMKWLRPRRNTHAHDVLVILIKGVCFLSATRKIRVIFRL